MDGRDVGRNKRGLMEKSHYSKLENMYLAAPINKFYNPNIIISKGKTEISIEVKEEFFHAANAVHGSVYFKLLDDAAFFAANSVVGDVFVLTASYETKLLRPVDTGQLIAKGEIVQDFGSKIEASAKLFNQEGKLIATGKGIFVKSKKLLSTIILYKN
jgi:uncharacterized protein (TIGR00369 family)